MAEKQKEVKDNLSLWNKVGVTDVRHTKKVTFGRKFTAIDAYSQIMEATEQFGLFGQGWGVRNASYWNVVAADGNVLIGYSAELFYNYDGKEGVIPIDASVFAVKKDQQGKERIDEDCLKKVSTDALTKGLSKLGFNADVFLGKFDDNKYVAQLEESVKAKEAEGMKVDLIKKLNEATTVDQVQAIWRANATLQKDPEFKEAVATNGKRLKPAEPEKKADEPKSE